MVDRLTMKQTAAHPAVNRHYDTFRKEWPQWVRDRGFPAPIQSRAPFRWREADIVAWEARSQAEATLSVLNAPPVANLPANCDRVATHPAGQQRRIDAAIVAAEARMMGAR